MLDSPINSRIKSKLKKAAVYIPNRDALEYLQERLCDKLYPLIDSIYLHILLAFSIYRNYRSKIFTMRLDFHYPWLYEGICSNKHISKTLKRLQDTLNQMGLDAYIVWVREIRDSLHPHYHVLMFLNGHYIQHPKRVIELAKHYWGLAIEWDATDLIHHDYAVAKNGDRSYRVVKRAEGLPLFLLRQILYFAKKRDKGPKGDGIRNFGHTELPRFEHRHIH